MTESPAPRPALAYHLTEGAEPTLVFLPGYASDMTGAKALALEAWAQANGRRFVRFDYGGCGASEGAFEEQTLAGWRDDALTILDEFGQGPSVLIGSSMGGWIALLVAREYPELVAGLVLVAPAPDFTDWGFSIEDKMALMRDGRLERASPYAPQPILFTKAFWHSGEANRVMVGPIGIACPVRLLHGQADAEVPYMRSVTLSTLFGSADVQTLLIKDGDHRLSRDADIALLLRAVEDVTRL